MMYEGTSGRPASRANGLYIDRLVRYAMNITLNTLLMFSGGTRWSQSKQLGETSWPVSSLKYKPNNCTIRPHKYLPGPPYKLGGPTYEVSEGWY
jgi:hypothetical protein